MPTHYDKLSDQTIQVRRIPRGSPNKKIISQCRKSVDRHMHNVTKKHQWHTPIFKQDPDLFYKLPKSNPHRD